MRETPVLVFTQTAGVVQIIPNGNVSKHLTFISAKGNINISSALLFYITINNVGTFEVSVPKHLKVGKIRNAPLGIVHSEDKCYSYTYSANVNISSNSVHTVHFKPTVVHVEQVAEHAAVKKKRNKSLRKERRK